MSESNELLRVCVRAGAVAVDLSLPAKMPVAEIIPSIVDMLPDGTPQSEATRHRLSLPGGPALAGATTLAQNGIRDGAVLLLGRAAPPAAAPRYDDVAEAVAATLGATAPPAGRELARAAGAVAAACLSGVGALALVHNAFVGNAFGDRAATATAAGVAGAIAVLTAAIAHRAYRDPTAVLPLGAIASAFAAVAGLLAVPGRPGMPNVLLAATATAVASVLAMRLSGCNSVALTAVAVAATTATVATLAGVLAAAPARALGSLSALVSLGLLGTSGRISIVLAGLSPRLDAAECAPDALNANAIRASRWLTSLLGGFSATAALGAVVTVLGGGGAHPGCLAFGAVTGAVLLLRARTVDGGRALAVGACGLVTLATAFGVAAIGGPARAPWIVGPWVVVATATLAAAAMFPGFVAPALSPSLRRGLPPLEWLALVAMAPLTCWICGAYGAVRGLDIR